LVEDTIPKFQEEYFEFKEKISGDVEDLYARLKTVASFDQLKDGIADVE